MIKEEKMADKEKLLKKARKLKCTLRVFHHTKVITDARMQTKSIYPFPLRLLRCFYVTRCNDSITSNLKRNTCVERYLTNNLICISSSSKNTLVLKQLLIIANDDERRIIKKKSSTYLNRNCLRTKKQKQSLCCNFRKRWESEF